MSGSLCYTVCTYLIVLFTVSLKHHFMITFQQMLQILIDLSKSLITFLGCSHSFYGIASLKQFAKFRANQWTGFYIIGTSVMKELKG